MGGRWWWTTSPKPREVWATEGRGGRWGVSETGVLAVLGTRDQVALGLLVARVDQEPAVLRQALEAK